MLFMDQDLIGSLLEFPCDFPVKVMGENREDFFVDVISIFRKFDSGVTESDFKVRDNGRYRSLTINFRACSRAQLDEIYIALTSHPLVKVVL